MLYIAYEREIFNLLTAHFDFISRIYDLCYNHTSYLDEARSEKKSEKR